MTLVIYLFCVRTIVFVLCHFGPPKGRSYEFSAVSQLVVSDAIPGKLVQEIF